jgi:hypothetical protein
MENRMIPLMLKTDFFVGIQQILVADITYYVLITAYPLRSRSQLTVTRTASDQLGVGSFSRHPFIQGFFGIHIPSPLSNFNRRPPININATILPHAGDPALKFKFFIISISYNK